MHTLQAFLTVILCGFVWLTIILSLALAGEVTIFEKPGNLGTPSFPEPAGYALNNKREFKSLARKILIFS
jgi:hypothetical protein